MGTVPFAADAYTAQRQATAAARQQRFDAAMTKPPPFAVREAEGGMVGAATTSFRKREQKELTGKIGGEAGSSFRRTAAKEPSFKVRGRGGLARRGRLVRYSPARSLVQRRPPPHPRAPPTDSLLPSASARAIPPRLPPPQITDQGKGWMWNQREVEELGRQRRDLQADNRAKHWGMKPDAASGLML